MLDILCRLFSRNTQILAQSKRTDSIHNTEINCFCISSLQICHFIKWYVEYLGSCHSVNISRFTICLDQLFITGAMRQNTKLDLRIIRIHKDTAFFSDRANWMASQRSLLNMLEIPKKRYFISTAADLPSVLRGNGGQSASISQPTMAITA